MYLQNLHARLLQRSCMVLLFMTLGQSLVFGQSGPIGQFEDHQDVGGPALSGSAVYNAADQTYLLSGAGKNIWTNVDQFQFVWKKIKGDFIIKATVRFIGAGVAGHRKIGIMARDKLTTDSRYADGSVHGGLPLLTALQYRAADGDTTGQVIMSSYHPTEIEFARSGNTFSFSAATFGENYKTVTKEMPLNEEAYVGLYICSHVENVIEQAVFSNVRIIIPADRNFKPYTDYIGSHLEIMDVATGRRKILYSAPNSLQAPTWTPDNKYLIYISDGLMYRYELTGGNISKINTGDVRDLNNDHVLSFNGKMIGISNHLGDRSVIYIMPVSGSDKPIQVTSDSLAPSYLHSWTLDGKNLIFTGKRNGSFNIWSINIDSRKETALTSTTTLNDGPELTPDGKFIYFNSVRTGTMKIWRMKADGSAQEQVTFDEYNDWFPHISPDGKWIVYESFPKDIDPTSHPFYKQIYLRLMPVSGGVPRTIAYIYGGQGTINVPSWSPDSKSIAFISNSKL
ncbi:MAG: biopolymer transporter TolR [Bacteroidota bacterium]|nr:biopolymer transporter TolR [Bacteroidota bacterium]MDP4244863.1 biopolymer transporter TolR [Bacteroidota bacterium]MDP4260468.1 biopolymer transporter TolR [Bacteroidota bacterium]